MVNAGEVRSLSLSMPEAEEQDHWEKPSFRVRNKIFAVLQPDGVTLLVKTTPEERAAYTTMDPSVYSVPTKYSTLNYMFVRMDKIAADELRNLIEQAWRCVTPKKLHAAYDAARR